MSYLYAFCFLFLFDQESLEILISEQGLNTSFVHVAICFLGDAEDLETFAISSV